MWLFCYSGAEEEYTHGYENKQTVAKIKRTLY